MISDKENSGRGAAGRFPPRTLFLGVLIAAACLYLPTLKYGLAGDDFPWLARARESGPAWTFFINRKTLVDIFACQEWQSGATPGRSDNFRPGNIWIFKFGFAMFGRHEWGYRLVKLMLMLGMIALFMRVVRETLGGDSWTPALLAGTAATVNQTNYHLMVRETINFDFYALGCCLLAWILLHRRWARIRSRKSLAAAAGAMTLGLCFRENALGFAGIAFLLDWGTGSFRGVDGRDGGDATGDDSRRSCFITDVVSTIQRGLPAYACYSVIAGIYLCVRYWYYGGSLGKYSVFSTAELFRMGLPIRNLAGLPMNLPAQSLVFCNPSAALAGLAVLLVGWLVARARGWDGAPDWKRPAGLVMAAAVIYLPVIIWLPECRHFLLPGLLVIAAVIDLSRLAATPSGTPQVTARVIFVLPFWAIYLALSLAHMEEDRVRYETGWSATDILNNARNEIRTLDAKAGGNASFVFLALPSHFVHDLFANAVEEAVPFWTRESSSGESAIFFQWEPARASPSVFAQKISPGCYEVLMNTDTPFVAQGRLQPDAGRFESAAYAVEILECDYANRRYRFRFRLKDGRYAGRSRVFVMWSDGVRLNLLDELICGSS
ncbi:MAG TPA: hypothetical protein PL033_14220 [Candidatus Brocadiia bacterium]|nr:hypothetical protein [Candidatus Brocadiia bacterium]